MKKEKSSALILNEDNKLLVVKKRENQTHFILPGGKREKNETLEEALKREIREEIGVELLDFIFIEKFIVQAQFDDYQIENYMYLCKVNGTPQAKSEISEIKWIDINDVNKQELASGIVLHAIPYLKEYFLQGRKTLSRIKNFIFDWDNTLFDYKGYWEKAHRQKYNDFRKINEITSYENFMRIYKENDEKLWIKVSNGEMTLDELRLRRMLMTMAKLKISMTEEEAVLFFDDVFKRLLNSIQPQKDLLKRLQTMKDKKIFILTNGTIEEQNEKLSRTGFLNQFPTYISEDIGFEKPNLTAFEYVIKKNNLSPLESVMIGDSLTNDILPAKKLGMRTVLVGGQSNKEADFSFESVTSFLDYIEVES
ncbi:mutator mutT protein/haloacid dehalogenase superfamily, subfamily IA, variant 3 with third motif having DD or ED/haloacid dehalogenase superfamily, subfamily IA, variant 1 with third motif having Dx(3-4)D or Dx(3-4)E [Pilibacter termitis]|uniref:Nudix hydrolase domain-containing protein n=1 Tax=Pilibacter termitis TaxID=263852 RepID=A0A1T4KI61_9ENTE|nr:HAD-IA family hydrolase [Pilibacter termitis]SJZ42066.1 mutator mutT protein/haloacid dehalogenase superfamily, subfamily IA, variant 3 with third motif having DD or ED/haloacid dehalogenase superfamily, subfamily IA, variant 1 with third motif having Dx(3-4)D or Dx(3-4)E [Pilibacter termitis]